MTIRFFLVTSIMVINFITTHGQAQTKEHKIDTTLEKCIAKDQSDIGMIECLQKAEKDWDKELNRYYKLLLAKLNTSEQKIFKESQRQWLIYKDKEVKFFSELFGKKEGTMWSLLIADKRMQIIRQRALELLGYYETITQN